MQLDEAINGSRDAHLICYFRFVNFTEQKLVEERLLYKRIELGCPGIDLFTIIDKFISTSMLVWKIMSAYAQMVTKLFLATSVNCRV